MVQQNKVFVAVQGDQPVVFEALSILAGRGVATAISPETPSQLPQGCILLTGSNLPTRFPSSHVRVLGQVVYVRLNPNKRERNPQGFRIAIEEMAIRLGVLARPTPQKESRPPRYLRAGRRTEFSLT